MEIIELTRENIETYLDECLEVQKYLVKSHEQIEADPFIETAKDDHSYFIGTLDDGRLIGMGVVSKIVHPVRSNAFVNNIVVHPDGRGKGLFGVIMDELEAKARAWGCAQVELTCSREAVQGMYEKRGYLKKETNFYIQKI